MKRPRTVRPLVNPITMAIHRASKLDDRQRADLLTPAREALDALSRGQGNVEAWQAAADAFNIGEALCELRIINNLDDMLTQAQHALAALMDRVHAGRGWTLYASELTAMHDGLWLYGAQLGHCSAGEHIKAVRMVERRIRGALSGSASPRARVHEAVRAEMTK